MVMSGLAAASTTTLRDIAIGSNPRNMLSGPLRLAGLCGAAQEEGERGGGAGPGLLPREAA
eukprot:6130623-Pyramimonas_sp.AAC.1